MPASPVVRTHAPRCTIWLYCYTPLVAMQICICWVNDQRRAVPGSIRSPHTISSRLVSAVRVGVSRAIASPSPTSGLPRRPRLDRPCIVIIHKFYSVRLSSSEGTPSHAVRPIRDCVCRVDTVDSRAYRHAARARVCGTARRPTAERHGGGGGEKPIAGSNTVAARASAYAFSTVVRSATCA